MPQIVSDLPESISTIPHRISNLRLICYPFRAIEREKAAVANVVIDNSGTRESTETQVEVAWRAVVESLKR